MKTRLSPAQRAALTIAVKTGVVEQCPAHWVYYRSHRARPLEHAYRLGNYLISRLAKLVRCFQGDRQKLMHAIKLCLKDLPATCLHCQYDQQP
ncbi:MAG TPA: hypothetical protein PKA06_03645 [Gemmatales bacterium]|nr:hypothetical protein [Gemmatales bacterium]HMP15479.1 hypothetical protein [Gemmatales bacterium]